MNRLMKKFNILGDQRLYTMRISDAVNKHKLPKLPNIVIENETRLVHKTFVLNFFKWKLHNLK